MAPDQADKLLSGWFGVAVPELESEGSSFSAGSGQHIDLSEPSENGTRMIGRPGSCRYVHRVAPKGPLA